MTGAAMLLLIDAGNTRIKWALAAAGAEPGVWQASGACVHAGIDQLATAWRQALHGAAVGQALLSNVAGGAVGARLQQQLELAGVAPATLEWFASRPQRAGLVNGYRNPAQLGCDRFAAAIGGHRLAPGLPIVVANCGTATTVDAITADGRFIGGMILPGLGLMASALARNTAALPHISADGAPPAVFADNTDEAIQSGCLAAQAGAIERACVAHGAALCLLSGGAAPGIAAALAVGTGTPPPYRMVDNIVLLGLHAAATSHS
jgi:type III pantothenate kinase